jgi:ketosteroid isomerase-like protein
MSVNEIQALAQRFADAFDKRDLKPALEMLCDDVEIKRVSFPVEKP